MSQDWNRPDSSAEDAAILLAIEHLESGEPLPGGSAGDRAASYLEVLAALPEALEPVAPPPALRRTLLAQAVQERADEPGGRVASFTPAAPAPGGVPRRFIPHWARALAAALLLAVLGLGYHNYRLQQILCYQQDELDSLAQAVMVGHVEAGMLPPGSFRTTSDPRFAVIEMGPPSLLFPMLGPGGDGVSGAFFICTKHQRWYLWLQGLEPARGDQQYHAWFVTDRGPMDAGVLDVVAGVPAQMSSDRMPRDTRGILISLEPPQTRSGAPSTNVVLEARHAIEV